MNMYTSRERVSSLESILPNLRDFTARELSCAERVIDSKEMSLRIIVPDASLKIADTEIEIMAFGYPERVKRQDEICLSIQEYVQRTCPDAGSVYVWLQLSELGHSSKE